MPDPIQKLFDSVAWRTLDTEDCAPWETYATHEGELTIMDSTFRVFQLNTGQRVFEAGDVERFFAGISEEGG